MKKNILKTLMKVSSVGIPELDAQHRELVRLIGGLSIMCYNQGKTMDIDIKKRYEFAKMVKQTLYNINYHIKYKEQLMEETGYPGLEEHKKFHGAFFMKFLEQVRAFESRNYFAPEKLPGFLYEWIDSHFFMDIDMSLHVKKAREAGKYIALTA